MGQLWYNFILFCTNVKLNLFFKDNDKSYILQRSPAACLAIPTFLVLWDPASLPEFWNSDFWNSSDSGYVEYLADTIYNDTRTVDTCIVYMYSIHCIQEKVHYCTGVLVGELLAMAPPHHAGWPGWLGWLSHKPTFIWAGCSFAGGLTPVQTTKWRKHKLLKVIAVYIVRLKTRYVFLR